MFSRLYRVFLLLILSFVPFFSPGSPLPENGYDFVRESQKKGDSCLLVEDYVTAFDIYLKGLAVSEDLGYDENTKQLYFSLGMLYTRYFDYVSACEYFEKSLDFSFAQQDTSFAISVLNLYIPSLCFIGNVQMADSLYKKACSVDRDDLVFNYYKILNKGHIAYGMGNISEALNCFKESADYAIRNNMSVSFFSAAYDGLIDNYIKDNQLDSALVYLMVKVDRLKEKGADYMLPTAYKMIAQVYKMKGMPDEASDYKLMYMKTLDSVMAFEDYTKLKSEHYAYEKNKSADRIKSLSFEAEQNQSLLIRQRKWIVFVVVLSVLLMTLFVIYLFRLSRKKEEGKVVVPEARSEGHHLKLDSGQMSRLIADIERVMADPEVFCRSDFSLDTLSKMLNSNTNYVSSVINDNYNKNFRTFLNDYRIEEAKKRLRDPEWKNYTIKAISESLGYKSNNNFIVIFKKATGETPSVYQKQGSDDEKM